VRVLALHPSTRGAPSPQVLSGVPIHDHVKAFRPPFEEFEIQLVTIPPGEAVAVPVNPGPLILLVQQGAGSMQASGPYKAPLLESQTDIHRGKCSREGLGHWVATVRVSGEREGW